MITTEPPTKQDRTPLREYRDHCNGCRSYIPGKTHYFTKGEDYKKDWNIEHSICEWCKQQRRAKAERIERENRKEEWGPLSADRGHYEGFKD